MKQINKEELFIVSKMIEGDIDSFKYFFDRYYNDLCNFVNIYLHSRILAEEIVQDIFVYFWENRNKLEINTSAKSFLFSAAKYKSLNFIRNEKNQQKLLENIRLGQQNEVATYNDSVVDTNELREILEGAINQLAPKCKEIFVLSKQNEFSNKEIAEKLNVSVKTVENQMTIALKKLREYLHPYHEKIFIIFLLQLLS